MILEHGLDDLTAKYNPQNKTYDIGQKTRYRWITNTGEIMTPWYTDIDDALVWIKTYDRDKQPTTAVVFVSAENDTSGSSRVRKG